MTGRWRVALVVCALVVLAGCGAPAAPFGADRECDGDQGSSGARPATVEAQVRTRAAGAPPEVWAGFQRRDGSVVTGLPACFDGVLALFLSDPRDGLGLQAQVEPDAARTVPARDGAGELLVRDSASFHAELLGRREDGPEVDSFAGWYVHLEEPARGTFTWEAPLVWSDRDGGDHRGTIAVRVAVQGG